MDSDAYSEYVHELGMMLLSEEKDPYLLRQLFVLDIMMVQFKLEKTMPVMIQYHHASTR